MKITPEQKSFIKNAFESMQSKADFLSLLNYAKKIIFGGAIAFDLRQLNYYINVQPGQNTYRTFEVKKKNGKNRTIYAPVKGLKVMQSCLNLILQQFYESPTEANGFVNGKSVVDNAKAHLGKIYVYNLDIKDFFPSIDMARFWGRLKYAPYNLNDQGRVEIANMICAIAGHRMLVKRKMENGEIKSVLRNVLPQGSPCSPVISNILCENLDRRLKGAAGRFGINYTRYADDITFSSNHSVYSKTGEFLSEVDRIISSQNFSINEDKVRLQAKSSRQVVTGLIVNKKVNVSRKFVEQLKMWLYYWEKLGYVEASKKILSYYLAEKGHVKKPNINIANVISGKLEFLRMVKGDDDPVYKKLVSRLHSLTIEEIPIIPIANKPIYSSTKQAVVTEDKPANMMPFFLTQHSPEILVRMLKNFSVNDSALKYTTHSWDVGRDKGMFINVSDFLAKAEKQYDVFSFHLSQLSKNLNGKIYSFIFRKNIAEQGWGTHRFPFGWSSEEILEQTSKDPSLNPEDVILPLKHQKRIGGKTIQKFKQVIDLFKNEIEIRDENSALLNLILEKHDKYLTGFETPIIKNLKSKTFYTDVQWLGKALDLIFENIASRDEFKKVSYILKDDLPDRYVLEITHIGSLNIEKNCTDEKLCLGKGSFGDIKHYLHNLCDWSIESSFAEGNIRINYLVSDPKTQQYQLIGPIEGFRHILTFYK